MGLIGEGEAESLVLYVHENIIGQKTFLCDLNRYVIKIVKLFLSYQEEQKIICAPPFLHNN